MSFEELDKFICAIDRIITYGDKKKCSIEGIEPSDFYQLRRMKTILYAIRTVLTTL
jgi:hypothetical protein